MAWACPTWSAPAPCRRRTTRRAALRFWISFFPLDWIVEKRRDMIGQRERRCQSRRLDAEQVHQPPHAVIARALHDEIRRGRVLARNLGADAGVARLERAVGQRGPVATDRGIEALGAPRIHRVVDLFHPFHVGAEARTPAEVERYVYAEAARLGHGVDEARKGRTPRQRVVVALGVVLGRRE